MTYYDLNDDYSSSLNELRRSLDEINENYNIPDYDACSDCSYFENIHYGAFGSKISSYCTRKNKHIKSTTKACSYFVKNR